MSRTSRCGNGIEMPRSRSASTIFVRKGPSPKDAFHVLEDAPVKLMILSLFENARLAWQRKVDRQVRIDLIDMIGDDISADAAVIGDELSVNVKVASNGKFIVARHQFNLPRVSVPFGTLAIDRVD